MYTCYEDEDLLSHYTSFPVWKTPLNIRRYIQQ